MSLDADPDFTDPKQNGQEVSEQQAITDVLDEHRYVAVREGAAWCQGCEWVSRRIGINSRTQHAAHLAEMLEPVIRDREAEAWDEGVKTTLNHAIDNEDGITLRLEHLDGRPWQNPYEDR